MKTKPVMKTRIIIELPDHVADAVVELSKTIDIGTLLRDALGEFASRSGLLLGHLDADIGASRCRQPEKGWIMQSKEQVEKLHAYVTNLRRMVMP